jgi:hypothetical protein
LSVARGRHSLAPYVFPDRDELHLGCHDASPRVRELRNGHAGSSAHGISVSLDIPALGNPGLTHTRQPPGDVDVYRRIGVWA